MGIPFTVLVTPMMNLLLKMTLMNVMDKSLMNLEEDMCTVSHTTSPMSLGEYFHLLRIHSFFTAQFAQMFAQCFKLKIALFN